MAMPYPTKAPPQAPAGAPARPATPAAPGVPAAPPARPQGQQNPQDRMMGMHTKIVKAAMKVLYQKVTVQQVLKIVAGAQDPAEGIAQASRFVAEQVVGTQAKAQGAPPQVANSALIPIAGLIIELAAAARIVQDGPELRQAVQAAISGSAPQEQTQRTQEERPAPEMGRGMIAGEMGEETEA